MDIIEPRAAVYLRFAVDGCPRPHVLTVERARDLAAAILRAADPSASSGQAMAERRAGPALPAPVVQAQVSEANGTLEAERKAA
jgi:hypothetical protein